MCAASPISAVRLCGQLLGAEAGDGELGARPDRRNRAERIAEPALEEGRERVIVFSHDVGDFRRRADPDQNSTAAGPASARS